MNDDAFEEIEMIHQNINAAQLGGLGYHISESFHASSLTNDMHLQPFFADVDPLIIQLRALVSHAQIRSNMREMDLAMDKCGRDLYNFCKGLSLHPDPQISEAAHHIMRLYGERGLKGFRVGYNDEITFVGQIVKDLQKPEQIDQLNLLSGANHLANNLITAYKAFDKAKADWELNKAQREKSLSITELKLLLKRKFNRCLVQFLRSTAYHNKATYGHFSGIVRQSIASQNKAIRANTSRRHNKIQEEQNK